MSGGAGDDTFIFAGTADVGAGETVDGGADTDTVRLTATTDLSTVAFTSIEALSLAEGADATFTGAQITGKTWTVAGTSGVVLEKVIVNAAVAATVNLSGITTVTNAGFQINGSTGDEVLTGSAGADTITGGLGSDALSGGDGNDTFVYNGTPEAGATETVNGGNGTDTVRLESNTNLTSVTLTSVEAFSLADGATLSLSAAQVTGQSWAINGTAGGGTESLIVTAATGGTADLSSLTGLANLSITVNGQLGAETLVGSSAADTIAASDGADSVLGGGGADSLSAGADADTVIGGAGSDTLSGGGGSDRFVFATGDAASTSLATLEVITDYVQLDDEIALGVTGTTLNSAFTTAASYADALTAATTAITAGTQDIIVIEAGTDTFVFADTNGDNVLDTVIQLTGTGLGLAFDDFVG
jgi:Ca2+-binding RTX toxin-like protein